MFTSAGNSTCLSELQIVHAICDPSIQGLDFHSASKQSILSCIKLISPEEFCFPICFPIFNIPTPGSWHIYHYLNDLLDVPLCCIFAE